MSEAAREYRSTTFALLFGNKKEALELCNAVYGTAYTEEDEVEFNTLTDADGVRSGFCAGLKNDLAFILKDYQHMFEHQSTVNPNMPLRMLGYYAEVLQRSDYYESGRYGTKRVMIPAPRFLVFYNGSREQPDEVVYRLSDSYKVNLADNEAGNRAKQPEFELTVRVLNINKGHNSELMERCSVLEQYAEFTRRVSERLVKGLSGDAVKAVVREVCEECIRDGILKDFLTEHMEEIIMSEWWEYDEKAHDKAISNESSEETRLEDIRNVMKSLGVSSDRAMSILNISEEDQVKFASLLR